MSDKSFGFRFLIWGSIMTVTFCVIIAPKPIQHIMALFSTLICGLLLWIWCGTFYELNDTHLEIRFGPFRESISYLKIFSVRKVNGMISSMALSSRMLELRHGKNYFPGTICISPADQDAFIGELVKRCPNLRWQEQNS